MSHSLENKKVLIVEDNKEFLWLLRQNFDNQEFSVSYALDGEEGLAVAQKEKPDLMIIDILLPKMDGITMVRKVIESGFRPKIIFLTNFNDPHHVSEVMELLGETDYIVKSDVHISAIVDRVKDKLGVK